MLLLCGSAHGQTLYKYRGDDGEWIYSDRPPADGSDAETHSLAQRGTPGSLGVSHSFTGNGLQFVADNRYYAPVEVTLVFESIEGVDYPHPDDDLRWVVPARSQLILLDLPSIGVIDTPSARYSYAYLPGDPAAQPDSDTTYRLPYAVGTSHTVTQAYPVSATHQTRDSMYAVDFSMPVGTDVVAARDGVVFDVAAQNFKGGPDAVQYADLANLVRILHDDGTHAVYAHLNWNSIRVSPGDRVVAGEYIADSGNTGFSSGPHLHFAVLRNLGMRVESLPVRFRGAPGTSIQPAMGDELTAYP
jgi:murein DD-endopeptidase MepM/ murein hydrolase activator NlpD